MWRNTADQIRQKGKQREKRKRNREKKMRNVLVSFLLTAIIVLLFTIFALWWMNRTWTNLSFDELLFTLKSSISGTDQAMIKDFCLKVLVPLLLSVFILFGGVFLCKRTKYSQIAIVTVFLICLIVQMISVGYTYQKLDVKSYIEANKKSGNGTEDSFIDVNYVDPMSVSITSPEKKRNLIYIYMESMESTYADKKNGGAFDVNYIPNLTDISKENESFSGNNNKVNGFATLNGTTWTMGALFSQASGLPLRVALDSNDMDTQDTFLNSVVTIGDILDSAGYNQAFMIGSDAQFGGRKNFYQEHGNFEIIDYYSAIDKEWIPEEYKVFWGYEDYKMLSNAKNCILEYASKSEPFNFTILTVDTHFEDGYVCENCTDEHEDNQYGNVITCADRQIAEFVEWIEEQDFYENTTVVLVGDHVTMDSDFCENVAYEDRRVYSTIINSAEETKNEEFREYSVLDMFPTTLASLGFEIEGNQLGLGVNLFSDIPTLMERYGEEEVRTRITDYSEVMESLMVVDTEVPELILRNGRADVEFVEIANYDSESGMLEIKVGNTILEEDFVESMIVSMKTEWLDDVHYFKLYRQEDGTYWGLINTNNLLQDSIYDTRVLAIEKNNGHIEHEVGNIEINLAEIISKE